LLTLYRLRTVKFAGLVMLEERSSDQAALFLHAPPSFANSNRLDGALRASISEVLTHLLGMRGKDAVCDYLARNHSFDRDEIFKHLPKFLELLQEMFGSSSAFVARAIARDVFDKLDLDFPQNSNLEFFDYVEVARTRVSGETCKPTDSTSTEKSDRR